MGIKLSIRELDPNDLAWSPEPIKLSYEHLDVLCFGTPALLALAQLAMPYDAYIRSVNESVTVPQNMEDFEVGTDLMDYLKKNVNFDRYQYITLETDAENNNEANHFYLSNGFRLSSDFYTFEGRHMNKYHYRRKHESTVS